MSIVITPGYTWKEGEGQTARKLNLAASPTATLSGSISVTGPISTTDTTEATTSGAGSITTLGGIYAAKKIIAIGNLITQGLLITGTSAVTLTNTAGQIINAGLLNSSITVNGTSITLGGSGTATAAAGTLTGTALNATVVNSSLTTLGTLAGIVTAASVKTSGYTLSTSDIVVVGNNATTPFTITMIAASSNSGRHFIIKNKGAATVTVDATALGTIDGANTLSLKTNAATWLVSDGAQWNRLNLQGV